MTDSGFDVFELVLMATSITVFSWNKIMFSYSFYSKIFNTLIICMNTGEILYGLCNCV